MRKRIPHFFTFIIPLFSLISIIIVIFLFDHGFFTGRWDIYTALRESNGWIFRDKPQSRTYASDYGATSQFIYFVFSEAGASDVDIYDLSGTFQGTLCFTDFNNGQPQIVCTNDLAYVRLKSNEVYIISCTTIVDHLTYQEANSAGYTHEWFMKQPQTLEIDGPLLYILDGNSNRVAQCIRPQNAGINNSHGGQTEAPLWTSAIILILVFFFVLQFINLLKSQA